jgi:hypothetical protein
MSFLRALVLGAGFGIKVEKPAQSFALTCGAFALKAKVFLSGV